MAKSVTYFLRFSITCKLFSWNQPVINLFMVITAVNHLVSRHSRKQKFTLTRSKGQICRLWLVAFDPLLLFFKVCWSWFWLMAAKTTLLGGQEGGGGEGEMVWEWFFLLSHCTWIVLMFLGRWSCTGIYFLVHSPPPQKSNSWPLSWILNFWVCVLIKSAINPTLWQPW